MSRKNGSAIAGIVGGMGPYAGLDFNQKVFDNTLCKTEQDHLEVYLLSAAGRIADRSAFLLDPERMENPARGIFEIIRKLDRLGVSVIAIPCNTSHSPPIMDEIKRLMRAHRVRARLLDIVEETYRAIASDYPAVRCAGLLATKGTYHSGIYTRPGEERYRLQVLVPGPEGREDVHRAIYDPAVGIKHSCNPVSGEARGLLKAQALKLVEHGARLIIMGCTEIPLALRSEKLPVPLVDPNVILARALIREAEPEKLKPLAAP